MKARGDLPYLGLMEQLVRSSQMGMVPVSSVRVLSLTLSKKR